jgi:hypothetical protein
MYKVHKVISRQNITKKGEYAANHVMGVNTYGIIDSLPARITYPFRNTYSTFVYKTYNYVGRSGSALSEEGYAPYSEV